MENGDLLYESNLVSGNGKISYKYPGLDITVTEEYKDGEKVFPKNGCIFVSENILTDFEILCEKCFENDKLIRIRYLNNKDGKPYSDHFFKNNGIEEIKIYYSSGKVKSEESNYFGEPNGTWQSWFENGKLKEKSNYDFGKLISRKCWDESGNSIDCKCYNNNGKEIKCP